MRAFALLWTALALAHGAICPLPRNFKDFEIGDETVHCEAPGPSMSGRVSRDAAGRLQVHTGVAVTDSQETEPLLAWGKFTDSINTTGWSVLEIYTNASFDDGDQAYAAGLLEGALTHQRIWEYIYNVDHSETLYSPALAKFVEANNAWVEEQVKAHAASDPVWYQTGLLYRQYKGIYDGYLNKTSPDRRFTYDVFYSANLGGDKDDLCVIFGCKDKATQQMTHTRRGDGHCSVLVKPINGTQELLTAHTTWSTLETMTRIYKYYNIPVTRAGSGSGTVPGRRMAFPSYPALLYSMDDFYTISSGLAVTETTIVNYNKTLWNDVTPQTLLDWVRNMVANRLATDGSTWASLFAQHNSGTYNNEFMIVDYNKFTPGQPLQDGLLTVLDQMPGPSNVVWADQTEWLRTHGYWASYNRPFYPYTQAISEQAKVIAKEGPHFSWYNTSRAVIFREHQGEVVDESSFRRLMRWNRFQTDAVGTQGCSRGRSASNAISERGDLTPADSKCIPDIAQQDEGGTDCKYTSNALMKAGGLGARAQSGPTTDDQPPFVWSQSPYASVRHIGQPDRWDFPWVDLSFSDEPL